MGRIDAIIGDELESQFRVEIAKRLGGKKGDLQIAVEEAVKLWIANDVIKELEETATSLGSTPLTRDKAIETMKGLGRVALSALARISHHVNSTPMSKDKALEKIDEILKSRD